MASSNEVTSTVDPVDGKTRGTDTKESQSSADSAVGTKLDPVCVDPIMTKESMSTDQLMAVSFPPGFSLLSADIEVPGAANASYASSKSSKSSLPPLYSQPTERGDAVLVDLQRKSESINDQVKSRTISRHGRSNQRWEADQQSNNLVRLVVGCVPILKDGRVMMVSSAKKSEWILPKGGWELDESMEESAIRETFEEAGVTGVLGPKLTEILYETRKAKKRRLSMERKVQNASEGNIAVALDGLEDQFSSGWSDVSQLSEDDHTWTEKFMDPHTTDQEMKSNEGDVGQAVDNKQLTSSNGTRKMNVHVTFHESAVSALDKPKDSVTLPAKPDENSSTSSLYSHVRLTLFPLYVTEVKQSWPEKRRLRKALTIEDAISKLEKRPELRTILTELKDKGLNNV